MVPHTNDLGLTEGFTDMTRHKGGCYLRVKATGCRICYKPQRSLNIKSVRLVRNQHSSTTKLQIKGLLCTKTSENIQE